MLEFNVKGQTLIRTDKFKPATDSEQYLKAKFTFDDEEWNGKVKKALFRVGSVSHEALLNSSNICTAPDEALVYVGHMRNRTIGCVVYVSLVGEYSTTKITTNEIEIRLNASGCGETVTPETPSEDVYQQLLTAYADTQADVAEAQAAVETAVSECNAAEAAFTDAKKTFGGLFANAIIGNMSGEVVAADDVSPVEHELSVKAHGKNYVDTSKITVQTSTYDIYISEVGEGYIDITTSDSYDGNGHCVTSVKLKELCEGLQEGKQYALSATSDAWNKMIYLQELNMFWSFGTRKTITKEILESTIGFYGLNVIREQGTGTCRISNIQIEEGYDITDYTPYIDPSTVTVSKYGKNIIKPYDTNSKSGYTVTKQSDGSVKVTGASTTASAIYLNISPVSENPIVLKKGEKYSFKWNASNGRSGYMKLLDTNGENKWITISEPSTILSGDDYSKIMQLYVQIGSSGATDPNAVGDTSLCGTYYFQLEAGEVSTDFEAYKERSDYTPESSGKVSGITSLSPYMTILTDTDGITIECEYVKDTNKVVGKLVDAINALGGSVTI